MPFNAENTVLHFHSAAQKKIFIRTSGIRSGEIVKSNLASLEVLPASIDWSKNDWVSGSSAVGEVFVIGSNR